MFPLNPKYLLLTTLFSTLLCAEANTDKSVAKEPMFQAVWQKVYGGEADDRANGVVMLEDGDVAIIGECKSFDAMRRDICVTRINSEGQTRWRKLIGGKKDDRGIALSRAKDGNLLILGEGKSFNENGDQDLYAAKLSLDGKVIWEQYLGGDRDEFAGGIAGTNDGGALVVGDSESFSKKGYKDILITKLDENGKVVSQHTIGGEKSEIAKSLTRTTDGNFMMVGGREIARSGDFDFFLLKLDQNGQQVWAKNIGEENEDILYGVAPTPDGGIVATGSTRSFGSEQRDLSVMYFDQSGELIWHKIYGFKYNEEGAAVTMTQDGGYMITGSTNSMGKGDYDIYVIALDNKGSLIWSDIYGDQNRDLAHGITRTTDGGLVIVGESDSFSRSDNFYMIKLVK